ncbi:MAG: serine protease [Deltaproteobacteria bacterium]
MRFAAAVAVLLLTGAAHEAGAETRGARCVGDYAEDLTALSPGARELEARTKSYSYAVRTTATYECVAYGGDGNLKTTRVNTMAYGTAFGYRHTGEDTLLLTNQHVAEWPAVTDADHPVDGVPAGCKRVADALRIVDNDHDDYAADDVPLTRVVVDPMLDIAILKAKTKLEVMPWKVGKSASVAARTSVEVKGYPLGAFSATNVGKVVSAYDHDDFGGWNHDDFVVDALLTHGGSGSPVLAISCKTGEWELVGVFHAHYSGASALNVVVAIDQVRDMMQTLKRPTKPGDHGPQLDVAARARVTGAATSSDPPFFAFGSLTASVRARPDGALVFAVYPADFPATTRPILVIEDLPDSKAFGALGTVYAGGPHGLQAVTLATADAESQQQLLHALTLLRTDAVIAFDYRAAVPTADKSRDSYEKVATQKKALGRMLDGQHDSVQAIVDLAQKLKGAGSAVRLADLETVGDSSVTPASSAGAAAMVPDAH